MTSLQSPAFTPDAAGPMALLARRLMSELDPVQLSSGQGELLRELLRFAASAEDEIGSRERRIQSLQQHMTLDDITGLENERGLKHAFVRASAASARYGTGHVLVLLAVNGLEDVAERHGRSIELWALQQLAAELRRQTRKSDVIARTGRSEFAVLLTPCPAEHAATKTASLAASLSVLDLRFQEHPLNLRASGGYGAFGAEAQFERILALAHQVLARRWEPRPAGFGRRTSVAQGGGSL
jgi:diguanylate cyclase (GGDEF)-like protein